MKKMITRIGALALAVLMVLSLCTTAFAADEGETITNGVLSEGLNVVAAPRGRNNYIRVEDPNHLVYDSDSQIPDDVQLGRYSDGKITVDMKEGVTWECKGDDGTVVTGVPNRDNTKLTFTVTDKDQNYTVTPNAEGGSGGTVPANFIMTHLEIGIDGNATINVDGNLYTGSAEFDPAVDKIDVKWYYQNTPNEVTPINGLTWRKNDAGNGVGPGDIYPSISADGSFPTGNKDNPRVYVLSITKDVTFTFTDEETGKVHTITTPVTFTATTDFWKNEGPDRNQCPKVCEIDGRFPDSSQAHLDGTIDPAGKAYYEYQKNSSGKYVKTDKKVSGWGIDVILSGSATGTILTKGGLAIEKQIFNDKNPSDDGSFTFTVKEATTGGQYLEFDQNGRFTGVKTSTVTDACKVQVPAGQKVILKDIPVGSYKITEIQKEGYIITDTDGNDANDYTVDYEVVDKDESQIPTALFTNKKLVDEAAISIAKVASGAEDGIYPTPTISIYAVDASGQPTGEPIWTNTLTPNGQRLYLNTTLPAGTYVIVETSQGKDGYSVTTTLDGDGAVVNGMKFTVENGKRYDLTVNNVYEKPKTTDVTITKQVTGNIGDWNKSFRFTVSSPYPFTAQLDLRDGAPTAQTVQGTGPYTVTVDLRHNDSVILNGVQLGSVITVYEENGGYTATATWDEIAEDGAVFTKTLPTTVPDEPIVLTVTNNLTAQIETGVVLDSLPYILILAAVALVGVLLVTKRKNRD